MKAIVLGPIYACSVLLVLFVAVNAVAGACILLPRFVVLVVRLLCVGYRALRRGYSRIALRVTRWVTP